jgi:tRNA dimethylallyltransferase
VVGPTGAGKTGLAIRIAERASTEIVSADSQQVYVGMDIGTAKPTAEENARVRHHLVDVLEPDRKMTAARFVELADAAIVEISTRLSADGSSRGVVVAGGTGLYVRALLLGLFEGPPADAELRRQLEAEAEAGGGAPALWERLREVDLESAARIDPNDLIRITRALEVFLLTGATMTEHHRAHDHRKAPLRYRARLIGLAPEREALYRRIDKRVDEMMAAGLLAEVEALRERGFGSEVGSQAAIGYAELHQHLDGEIPLAEAVRLIKRNSRRYARRQLSWYRDDSSVEWYASGADVDLEELGRYLSV